MTYYDVLGVNQSAKTDELRQAYRLTVDRLTKKRATVGPAGAGDVDRAIEQADAAWATLSNTARRAEYDRSVAAGLTGEQIPAPEDQPPAGHRPRSARSLPGARFLDDLLPRRDWIESESMAVRNLPRRRLQTGLAIIALMVVITVVFLVLAHVGLV